MACYLPMNWYLSEAVWSCGQLLRRRLESWMDPFSPGKFGFFTAPGCVTGDMRALQLPKILCRGMVGFSEEQRWLQPPRVQFGRVTAVVMAMVCFNFAMGMCLEHGMLDAIGRDSWEIFANLPWFSSCSPNVLWDYQKPSYSSVSLETFCDLKIHDS